MKKKKIIKNHSMTSLKFLKWNCISVTSSGGVLELIVSITSPDVTFLQESWLSPYIISHVLRLHAFRLDRNYAVEVGA